jgi:hypothetical protein
MRLRTLPVTLAATAAVALAAGCGDDGGSGSGDPSAVAPADSLIFVEGIVRPSGEMQADVDALASRIAGVDNLGDLIVEELEGEAREEGEKFDFEAEVEPWLGDRVGFAWQDGEQDEPIVAVQSTDADAAQEFIDAMAQRSDDGYRDGSYEGVEYKLDGKDDVIGVVGDFVVAAQDEADFKRAVDASEGESLADVDRYDEAIGAASEASMADAYIDVGGLIKASEGGIDDQAQQIFESAGIDPSDATAVASVIPGSDQVEIEISSDLAGQEPPEGDASELISSMPADSLVAIGSSGFGEGLKEGIDTLDEEGIPGEVPPGQLKKGLKQSGIDLEAIVGSLRDAALFVTGSSERTLGGALVLTTADANQSRNTVSNIGTLLRTAGTPGVTAIGDGASGFSIRSEDLGPKPLVVAAKGDRVAIGYGVPPTLRGLGAGGATLGGTPAFEAAVKALGDTPLTGFVDGPAAVRLVDSLIRSSGDAEDRAGFAEARPYLRKIESVAIGSERDGDLAVARLIVSLTG